MVNLRSLDEGLFAGLRVLGLLALCTSPLVVACSDSQGPEVPDVGVHLIALSAGNPVLAIGDTTSIDVAAFDADGFPVTYPDGSTPAERAEISAGQPGIVEISGSGRMIAIGEGSTQVVAELEGRRDSVLVQVAGTVHGGPIDVDQTWSAAESPHFVRSRVHVGTTAPATITIEAGAEVRFSVGAGLFFDGAAGGTLKALGTESRPIRMLADAENDTSDEELRGHWTGLAVTDSESELRNVEMRHCGGISELGRACLLLLDPHGTDARPTVENLGVHYAEFAGVRAGGGAGFGPASSGLVISHAAIPLVIEPNEVGTIPADAVIVDNAAQRVDVDDLDGHSQLMVVRDSQTWPNLGVPYWLVKFLDVEGPEAPLLRLSPGVVLVFADFDAGIRVGNAASGGLRTEGTAEQAVRFEGFGPPTPTASHYWVGILFGELALVESALDHAIVESAGRGHGQYFQYEAAIVVRTNGRDALISNTHISWTHGCGILRAWEPSEVNTDYTVPEVGNSFSDNLRGDQCGP